MNAHEKRNVSLSEFSCWRAVLYNDTGQLLSVASATASRFESRNLADPGLNLSRKQNLLTLCLRGRPRLGFTNTLERFFMP